jgi:hypothetical protein
MNCVKGRSHHELKRIFKRLDINGDKKLDRKEFRKFEDELFEAADGDSNLALDFQEFAALRCNKGRDEQELKEIFGVLDQNHDGKVDRQEFKKLDLKTKENDDHRLGTHHKYLHVRRRGEGEGANRDLMIAVQRMCLRVSFHVCSSF